MACSCEEAMELVAQNKASIDLLWTLLGGVLIFFMQTGFALLESGSVRSKNYQNVLVKNIMDICVSGVVWWAFGYALAYGNLDSHGVIGTSYFFCRGFGYGDYALWFLRWSVAASSATIVSGSLAERVNIKTYIVFSAFMTGFIHPTIAAWTWNGGFLN